jgi:hypothetical protein
VRKKIFCTGPTVTDKAGKNYLVLADKPKEPTKEGTLSFVLHRLPFASVPTVSMGHHSLWSLWELPIAT